jgi:ABC-type polysaccharide/polyol phosphate export permease
MSYVNVHSRELPFLTRYAADLFTYRHLCWNLVGADLRARFRRSRLGILWAIIQPLAFALMIAAVWGGMFNVADYWAFAIYVFSGRFCGSFSRTSLSDLRML